MKLYISPILLLICLSLSVVSPSFSQPTAKDLDYEKALALYEKKAFDSSIFFLKKSASIQLVNRDTTLFLNRYEDVFYILSQLDRQKEFLNEERKLLPYCIKKDTHVALTLMNFAGAYLNDYNYSKAEKNYKLAMKYNTDLLNKSAIYGGLGYTKKEIGDYTNALVYYRLAEKISTALNRDDLTAKFNFNIGQIYERMNLFREAKSEYLKALEKTNDDKIELLKLNINLGTLYLSDKLNDKIKALIYFNKSMKIQKELTYFNHLDKIYRHLGTYYVETNNFAKAKECLTKSINEQNKQKDAIRMALIFEVFASLEAKQHNYEMCLMYYDKCISLYRFKKDDISTLRCINNKTSILLLLSKYKRNAFYDARLHSFLADSLIDLMRQEHTEQGSKLFWREKTHSLYENALETCYQLKDPKNAFYFMEKSRAILLLDALKDLDAKQVLSATQQSTEQDLRYRVIGLQNKLESLAEKDKNYNATYQQLIDTKEKYNAFIQSLEKTNPAYYQLKYNSKYLTLSDLQNKLKSTNQSFVEYFVGDSAVYVMAITATKVDFKKLNLATYRNLVGAFQTAVSQVPQNSKQQFETFKYIANQLYAYIFAPLHLPKGRIIISQDNYFIPFTALITDLKNTKYLIEDYAFSYAYSANVLFKKQDENWHFRHQLLGVSPVDFSALGMNSLPKSDETLKAIEQNYFSGKVLLNEQATKQNFIENAPKYSLLQLFTHGKADSTEAGSKIYFYDKILKLSELYQLPKLSANLVVLSACQTNLGKNATGEGIMSFARGFAYLNVPSTVSTLWSVDNEATYQITEAFYKFLDEGFEKDIALQKAQLAYLKNKQIDPYYWSGMVLVGDAEKLQNWSWIYYTIVASFVLIITFLIVRRKKLR